MAMSWGTIDDDEFQAFVKQVNAKIDSDQLKKEISQSARKVGTQTLKGVKSRTPVDSGTLRRGWQIEGPFISSLVISLTVSNNIEYAPFVESGHRTRGGVGWVPGSHMLMETLFEIDNQLPELLTPALQRFLQGLF